MPTLASCSFNKPGLILTFNKNTRRVLSYDVLRQQKTELWPRRLCSGGVWPPSPAYNIERVTNTSSSSCANNGDGRRRECSARRRPSRLYFSHFVTRTVYNTVDLYAVYTAIFVQNRVFCLPHLHSTPPLGGFPSEYRHTVWHGKTRMACYAMVEKNSKIYLVVLTQLTNVTDGQIDTAWRQWPRLCIASRGKHYINHENIIRRRSSDKKNLYLSKEYGAWRILNKFLVRRC